MHYLESVDICRQTYSKLYHRKMANNCWTDIENWVIMTQYNVMVISNDNGPGLLCLSYLISTSVHETGFTSSPSIRPGNHNVIIGKCDTFIHWSQQLYKSSTHHGWGVYFNILSSNKISAKANFWNIWSYIYK